VQAVAGRSLTAAAIADSLGDVPQATLYRHIGTLVQAGVLAIAEERPVRGATERVYVLAEGGAILAPAELSSATREDHLLYYFTVFVPACSPTSGATSMQTAPTFSQTGSATGRSYSS
jgi:predicted ArsR family transcriptional regulator